MLSSMRRVPRRGNVTVWVLACLPVLIGILAIVLDGGRLMDERRRVQATADAAALAAGADLYENYAANAGTDPQGTAADAARRLAAANGFPNNGTNSIVAVHSPPQSGPFAGRTDFIEVIIQSNLQGSFSAAFTNGAMPVRARAVARGRAKSVGLHLLHPNAVNALELSSDGDIRVIGASVVINSNSLLAMLLSGAGKVEAVSHDVTGGIGGLLNLIGPARTGVPPTPDPLRTLPPPDLTSYPVKSTSKYSISSPGTFTLQPGIYRGGINISSTCTVTLQPGIYIMDGGGFQISGQANVTGTGVMIYNTGGASGDQIKISGNGILNLSAPTTGPYRGISIFQDPTLTKELQLSGNGSTQLTGTVYVPTAKVQVSGNGTTLVNTLGGGFICSTMQVSGNGDFTINSGSNRPPLPDVGLVE